MDRFSESFAGPQGRKVLAIVVAGTLGTLVVMDRVIDKISDRQLAKHSHGHAKNDQWHAADSHAEKGTADGHPVFPRPAKNADYRDSQKAATSAQKWV